MCEFGGRALKKPWLALFIVVIVAMMHFPAALSAGEWFEFNEDFSGDSSHTWAYSHATWFIQDEELHIRDIEQSWMGMASTTFWPWDYFAIDVDIHPFAVPDPDAAFGIYVRPYASHPLAIGGGKVDLVGASFFAKDGAVDLAGWDTDTERWLTTDLYSPSGPVNSIGFSFKEKGVTLRINMQDVPITLPVVSQKDAYLFVKEVTLSAWGEGTHGSFDNVRARPLSSEDPGPSAILPPTNLGYSLNGLLLTISWDGVAGVTGYRLGIGMQPGDYIGVADMGPATSLGPADVSGVPPGTYFVAVKSYNGTSESPYSDVLPVVIPTTATGLGVPRNLRYETQGAWLTFAWNAVQGAEGYRLHVATQPGSYLPPIDVGSANRIGPIDLRVLPAGSYYLTVSAYNTQQEGPSGNELELQIGGQVNFGAASTEGSVSGSYVSYPAGKETAFSAQPLTGDRGTARYETSGSSEILDIFIDAPDSGYIIWKGMQIDGSGVLTTGEKAALDELATSEIYRALMMAPLEVACSAVSDPSSPALAALLLPWQLILKYLEGNAVGAVQIATNGASCVFFPDQKTGPPPGGQSAKQAALILSHAAPLPVVFGYFPMDTEGAFGLLETASLGEDSWIESPHGPCNAICRGACGADCPLGEGKNCERSSEEWICLKDEVSGELTGRSRLRVTYKCWTHPGCQEHDDCYDECNRKYGCDSFLAGWCRHNAVGNPSIRGCDLLAADGYGPSVGLWAQGEPGYEHKPADAFTEQLTFRYWEGHEREDPACVAAPSSCDGPGAEVLYALCNPPPYSGCPGRICRVNGGLWFEIGGNTYPVVAINSGEFWIGDDCYWESSVVTANWTYEGNLCSVLQW